MALDPSLLSNPMLALSNLGMPGLFSPGLPPIDSSAPSFNAYPRAQGFVPLLPRVLAPTPLPSPSLPPPGPSVPLPDLSDALLGGAGAPTPPDPLQPEDYTPSTKQLLGHSIGPAVSAAIAAMFGGLPAAYGAATGGQQAMQEWESKLKQDALVRQKAKEDAYARDVTTYNERWTRAKQRADILSGLSKQAMEFDDPEAAKAWLVSQRPIYAAMGVDPVSVLQGGELPGQSAKIEKLAFDKWKSAYDIAKGQHKDGELSIEEFNNSYTLPFMGKRMRAGELAKMGGVSAEAGAPTGTVATKADATGLFNSYVDMFVKTTGRQPDAHEKASMLEAALSRYAQDTHYSSPVDEALKRAQLAKAQLEMQKLHQDMAFGFGTGSTDEQAVQSIISRVTGSPGAGGQTPGQVIDQHAAASTDFNRIATAYDTIRNMPIMGRFAKDDVATIDAFAQMNGGKLPADLQAARTRAAANTPLTFQQRKELENRATTLYAGLKKAQGQIDTEAGLQMREAGGAPGQLSPQGSITDAPQGVTDRAGRPQLNEAALMGLNEAQKQVVRNITNGRLPLSARQLTTPQGMALLQRAVAYDPSFDATTYPARVQTAKDYAAGGKQGQTIIAVKTALHHMKELSDLAEQLGEPLVSGNIPGSAYVEGARNTFARSMTKGRVELLNQFNAVRSKLSGELSKIYTGGVPTEGEVKMAIDEYNSGDGPAALSGVLYRNMKLMMDRFIPLQQAYDQTMGASGEDFLGPLERDNMRTVTQRYAQHGTTEDAQALRAAQRPQMKTRDGIYEQLPDGRWQLVSPAR